MRKDTITPGDIAFLVVMFLYGAVGVTVALYANIPQNAAVNWLLLSFRYAMFQAVVMAVAWWWRGRRK